MQENFFLKNQMLFFLPAIGWFVLSVVLLTLPPSSFPEKSWLWAIPWFDKWVHIGLFTIMVVLLCWGFYMGKFFPEKLKYYFLASAVSCFAYGIVMEFVQRYWVVNRSFSFEDILADGAGVATGVVYSFKRYIKK